MEIYSSVFFKRSNSYHKTIKNTNIASIQGNTSQRNNWIGNWRIICTWKYYRYQIHAR